MKEAVFSFFRLMRRSLKRFNDNNPLRMAGATAFFASFALPPIMIIIIQLFGFFTDADKLRNQLGTRLNKMVGEKTVDQLMTTLEGFKSVAHNWYITIGGFLFLIFVGTTLFKVIRDSINELWNIRVHRKTRAKAQLVGRLKSFVIILLAGILFLTTLIAEGLQSFLSTYFIELFPNAEKLFNTFLSRIISLFIVSIWFTVIFKFLADGVPSWKVAITGGLFTGVFFSIGKFILVKTLTFSNLENIYGASGSLVLLLLFVFYVSFILYFGSMFTYLYAKTIKDPILPRKHAFEFELVERDEH